MDMHRRRWLAASSLAILATSTAPGSGRAQSGYPSRPIRIVIPFAAGSGSDTVARTIGEALAAQMGTPVVPEMREGAGGAIGAAAVAKAAPDGYTLLSAATPMTVAPYMMRTLPFDPAKDFTAIARVTLIPLVLVTGSKSPLRTFGELVERARQSPELTYATGGKGSPSHLEVELVNRVAGIRTRDIPYRNFGQGLTDTVGGQVDFAVASLPLALGHIRSGALRALMVGAPSRVATIPDVPTFAEALGRPGHEATVWYGLVAPAGTPPDVVARLSAEIEKALASPPVRERIERVGGQIALLGSGPFGAQIRAESERWATIVRELQLTAE